MKLSAVILLLCCAVGQAQAPSTSAPPALRTQSTVVLVPALVNNAKGELVFTLNAGDFRVTDDGIEQPLTLDEDTGSEPLALVVAVEVGGGGRAKLDNYRHLGAVIGAVVGGVPHRVAVVAFDSTPSLVQDFTPDVDAVGAALNDFGPGDKGAVQFPCCDSECSALLQARLPSPDASLENPGPEPPRRSRGLVRGSRGSGSLDRAFNMMSSVNFCGRISGSFSPGR